MSRRENVTGVTLLARDSEELSSNVSSPDKSDSLSAGAELRSNPSYTESSKMKSLSR